MCSFMSFVKCKQLYNHHKVQNNSISLKVPSSWSFTISPCSHTQALANTGLFSLSVVLFFSTMSSYMYFLKCDTFFAIEFGWKELVFFSCLKHHASTIVENFGCTFLRIIISKSLQTCILEDRYSMNFYKYIYCVLQPLCPQL